MMELKNDEEMKAVLVREAADEYEQESTSDCEDGAVEQNDMKPFDPRKINVRTHASFRDEHTFTGLDGTRHVCFSHCKNKFLNLRIYFDVPSDLAAPIFIGHIGGHCDTVKFH